MTLKSKFIGLMSLKHWLKEYAKIKKLISNWLIISIKRLKRIGTKSEVEITKSLKEITPQDNNKPVISSQNGLKINNKCERIITERRKVTNRKMVKKALTLKLIQSSWNNKLRLFWKLLIKKNQRKVVIAAAMLWTTTFRIIIIGIK